MNSRFRKKIIFRHLIGWALFIGYEVSLVFIETGSLGNIKAYILHYLLNIAIFYCNVRLFKYSFAVSDKPYAILTVFVIAEIVIAVALKILIDDFLYGFRLVSFVHDIIPNLWQTIFFIGFSTAYWLALLAVERSKKIGKLENEKLIEQNEKIKLEKNLLLLQNAYLNSQINPHLLFNTLNFLYNSIRKASPVASKTVLLLSDIMRYALSDLGEDGKVELIKEIANIKNYIELNQLRFNHTLNINLNCSGNFEQFRIIPLVLLTLIENVFQHGDLTVPDIPAHIDINEKDGIVYFYSQNLKRKSITPGNSIGTENLETRLDSYYGPNYKLVKQDAGETFKVSLEIKL